MSRTAQSGLRTIKRDYSSTSMMSSSSQPIDVDSEIDWPPTPPQPTRALTGAEKRLKDIQDALSGKSSEPATRPLSNPSQFANKRPNPTSSSQYEPPAKKRQLPNTWSEPMLPPSKQAIASSASSKAKSLVIPAAATSKASSKPAKVFLSQEQTQILKLVGEGHSVFYTGSAGEFLSLTVKSDAYSQLFQKFCV